jgi:hypothetical protein
MLLIGKETHLDPDLRDQVLGAALRGR